MNKRSVRRKKKQLRRRILRLVPVAAAVLLLVLLIALLSGTKDDAQKETSEPTVAPIETVLPEATQTPEATPIPEETPAPTETPEEENVQLTIHFGGDCTFGCNMNGSNRRFAQAAKKMGYAYFLENFAELFASDDLTVVNLEGPLTTATKKRANREFNFKGSPEYAQILSLANVEAVTLANNHAKDYLTQGLTDTKKACEDVGVTWFGYTNVATMEIKGVKIALIGVTQWDIKQSTMVKMVQESKKEHDIVIVYYHWGEEKEYAASSTMKKLGHKAIDAGADIVVGSHPHVPGGIEIYKGKRIVYSLGNFCFGGNDTPYTSVAYLYRVTFDFDPNTGTVSYADEMVLPIRTYTDADKNDFKPYLLEGEKAVAVLKTVAKYSKSFSEKPDFQAMAAQFS